MLAVGKIIVRFHLDNEGHLDAASSPLVWSDMWIWKEEKEIIFYYFFLLSQCNSNCGSWIKVHLKLATQE